MADVGPKIVELLERIQVLQDMLATYAMTVHEADQPILVEHLKKEIAVLRDEIAKQRRLQAALTR